MNKSEGVRPPIADEEQKVGDDICHDRELNDNLKSKNVPAKFMGIEAKIADLRQITD